MKITFFKVFKGLSVAKNLLRPESVLSNKRYQIEIAIQFIQSTECYLQHLLHDSLEVLLKSFVVK